MSHKLGPIEGKNNAESRRVERERFERLRAIARRAAFGRRKYGRYSEADLEDAVQAGVMKALEESNGEAEEEARVACRGVGNYLRGCQRRDQRLRKLSEQVSEGMADPFLGSRRPKKGELIRPKGADARVLAEALEIYERALLDFVRTGALARASRLRKECTRERKLYFRGVAMVVKHTRVKALDRCRVVDQLVEFRQREIKVQCPICSPSSSWIMCEHTMPAYKHGDQTSGTDLRGRGRRSRRWPLLLSFNDGPYVDRSDYLVKDAASRLSTELLRLCGVNPYVKHTLERQRDKIRMREWQSFHRDWLAGRVKSGERARRKARQRDRELSPEQWQMIRAMARRSELLNRLQTAVNVEIDGLCLSKGSGGCLCKRPLGHDGEHACGLNWWDGSELGAGDDFRVSLKTRKAWEFDRLPLPELEGAASDLEYAPRCANARGPTGRSLSDEPQVRAD